MSATMTARIATKAFRAPLQHSAFSTTARYRAVGAAPGKNTGGGKINNKAGESPVEIPAFNLRHITSNPRTRSWLIAGFCVIASIEAYGWFNFGPKILGWEERKAE
ncbi:hypothetical protein EsH8_II_001451 [Colletotrichum jinshuiense]